MEAKKLKYFTKFLPVEGEIKEGDKYSFGNRILTMTKEIIEREKSYLDMSDEELDNLDITEGRRIKHKLFLCSRDIQVGDKECVISNSDGSFTQHMECEIIREDNYANFIRPSWGQINSFLKDCFKVIGEILTPGIAENQEFTEDEIKLLTII